MKVTFRATLMFLATVSLLSLHAQAQSDQKTLGDYKREVGFDFIKKMKIEKSIVSTTHIEAELGPNCTLRAHGLGSNLPQTISPRDLSVVSVRVPIKNGPFLVIYFDDRMLDRVQCEIEGIENMTLEEISKEIAPLQITELKN